MYQQEADEVPVAFVAPINPIFPIVKKTVASAFNFFGCIQFDFQHPCRQDNLFFKLANAKAAASINVKNVPLPYHALY